LSHYRTAPTATEQAPKGIPYIIGNEAAERFSFYGMRSVLTVFMTKYLMDSTGQPEPMGEEDARAYYHIFAASVYFTPIFGALLADIFLGKYRTILSLSIVYCLGHFALALDETRTGLTVGLTLIAIGAGGIKPCVSAHVGDQFGQTNQHLLSRVFRWFYFSINVGAFASTLLTPVLLDKYGPQWAFGIPGGLMFLATILFWMGRNEFVHIPPGGLAFARELVSREGLRAIGQLLVLYFFIAPFWALFDQTASAWVLQANHMDRHVFGVELLPSQVQAANPILVLLFIPLFSAVIYPRILSRFFEIRPLRIIGLGLVLTTFAAAIPAWLEMRIQAGERPSIVWHLYAYAILTAAEVMVSITCLEFSYTQAPKTMKSVIMSLWFLSVATGNYFTAGVNFFIQNDDGTSKLAGASYYWFFTGVVAVAAALFAVFARFYKEKTYIQDDDSRTRQEPEADATP